MQKETQKETQVKISFYLRNPEQETSSIRIVVASHGKKHRRQAGVSVRTDRWKKPKNGIQTSADPKVSDKLKEIRLNLEAKLSDLSTPEEIEAALDEVLPGKEAGVSKRKVGEAGKERGGGGRKKEAGVSFAEYFKAYSGRSVRTSRTTLSYTGASWR